MEPCFRNETFNWVFEGRWLSETSYIKVWEKFDIYFINVNAILVRIYELCDGACNIEKNTVVLMGKIF
jgi:hypothetical protein